MKGRNRKAAVLVSPQLRGDANWRRCRSGILPLGLALDDPWKAARCRFYAPVTEGFRVLVSNSQRSVRVDRARLARLVRFVAREEGQRLGQIDLAVVARGRIASLNRQWLGRGGATDVLSFDLSEGGGGLSGQLVVCGDVARSQARLRGLPAQRELMLYVVHGLLHLAGYEDRTVRGAARMHAREEEILRAFVRASRHKRGPEARISKSEIRNKHQ